LNSLDLHGVKHSDVIKVVDDFLWENMNNNSKEVEIITGLSEQMKRIVYDICDEYKMKYQEVYLNKGKLIIIVK